MYEINTHSSRVEKSFLKITCELSESREKELYRALENHPKGKLSTHTTIKKVGRFWQLDVNGGGRIIYEVYDDLKIVMILFAGNHKDAQTFLRRNWFKIKFHVSPEPYPCLVFSGDWMIEEYGIEIGDTVEVVYLRDRIVVKAGKNKGAKTINSNSNYGI